MTRVIFYGRYSSDLQRDASIEDQYRNCARFAEGKGWGIERRYEDRAISGAVRDRPGYQGMLKDGEAKRFDVLLVDDLSRLSRDDLEMKRAIRRLRFLGIRIVGVSDGFDSTARGHKIQAGIRGLMNEIYLDDLAEKTHRGLAGQALMGRNAGGRSFGYRHVAIEDPRRRDHVGRPVIVGVRREIEPAEGEVVRNIYELYASGHSPRSIADKLNRGGVRSPRGGMWAASAIHGAERSGVGILNNPLYVGRFIWNRSQWTKDPDTGRRKRTERPETDWIVQRMPELRIVSDDLWTRVKARRAEQRARSEKIRIALHANARTGRGPKYLLSSLLRCGVCGGSYAIMARDTYGCATRQNRGAMACDNRFTVSRKLAETRILAGIKRDLFRPEAVALFREEVSRLLRKERARSRPDRSKTEGRIATLEAEIGRMVDAIRAGVFSETLKAELQSAETERARLKGDLRANHAGAAKVVDILPRALERYERLVGNLESVAMADVAHAREQIRALTGGEIKLVPTPDGHLEAELTGDYGGVLRLAGTADHNPLRTNDEINLVAGAGFEPAAFGL
jgi:DNA invertase Pin-like site-specific DNA recombinase